MTLYVCWGTFPVPWPRSGAPWGPKHHPCKVAHDALKDAGHAPEVVRVYGLHGLLPSRGRRKVRELSGQSRVPVLVLDDGAVIADSQAIAAWAREHPAAS